MRTHATIGVVFVLLAGAGCSRKPSMVDLKARYDFEHDKLTKIVDELNATHRHIAEEQAAIMGVDAADKFLTDTPGNPAAHELFVIKKDGNAETRAILEERKRNWEKRAAELE